MPITIGSNIASLTAQRRLSEGTSQLSKTFERLSSGQRINKAADDAAGLAISESLKADKRVFNQGIRNFNDGVSMLNIADSAIESLSGIVIRLKELAEQSANGTYGVQQRKALDQEAQALSKEYSRIVHSTKFNGVHLLDGSLGNQVRLQGGYGLDGSIFSGIGGAIGNGNFGTAVTNQILGHNFMDTTLGDLNGDGALDIVSVGFSPGFIAGYAFIEFGKGDGTFGPIASYEMSSGAPSAVALGDLNGDGILDIVSASTEGGGGRATIRLGKGDGTFGSAVSYQMESFSSSALTLGDLNGDGILDMVSAGIGVGGGHSTVRLGNGDGTFASATSYQTESIATTAITLGDLNGDGILDMVSAGSGVGGGRATIRLGTGNGTFGTAVSYQSEGSYSESIALGDLNGDGILDMLTAGYASGGRATVRIGNGNGTFGIATSYQMESNITNDIALGDINGDGFLDMVSSGDGGVGSATRRLGNGDGTFGSAVSYEMGGNTSYAVTIGDLNGDGVLDIVASLYMNFDQEGLTSVNIGKTQDGTSPLLSFDLKTLAGARQALPVFDQKIQQLAKQRGQIGAFQSRVQVGINNLQTASENYAAAESRIRDADIADESSKLVRLNILQQAASSVLSQANLQPQLALRLLS